MTGNDTKPKSVLVLDDDVAFQELIGGLLKAHGYEVLPARSASEASFLLAGHQPSLLIVDYRLPVMDGMCWISKLRESGNNTPIIFVSGTWCDAKTFNWLRNILHVSLVFRKPIDPHLFLQAVEDVLPLDHSVPAGSQATGSHESYAQAGYEKFLEEGNFDENLEKLDELIAAAGEDQVVINELTQIRRKVRTQRAVHTARVQYIERMPTLWSELVTVTRTAHKNLKDLSLVQLAADAAHKLKGTSGSYGLTHISEIAGHLETFLKSMDSSCTIEELSIYWSEIDRLITEGDEVVTGLTKIDLDAEAGHEERLISLLLVSPNEDYHTLTARSVASNIDVHLVNSAAGAITRASSMPFDVAAIDLSLDAPGLIAPLTKSLRSVRQYRQMPFIFIADPLQYTNVPELVYSGCASLLVPPLTEEALERAVRSLRGAFRSRAQKILCVDDDPMLTFFLTCVLKQEGFEVETLNEPIHILESLDRFQPDLILLDVIMPGISGYEVCRMLRAHPQWNHIPVIFLTVKNDMDSRGAAFQAGGNDFLAKPVLPQELSARVNAYVAAEEHQRERDPNGTEGILPVDVFKKQSIRILDQCNKENIPASLAVILIEGYHQLDEKNGDYARQQALSELGDLISIRFRTTDIRGSLKDGAFAVLFKGESSATTTGALEMLQEEFARSSFTKSSGEQFHIVLKFAVADAGAEGLTFDSLLANAVMKIGSAEDTFGPAALRQELQRQLMS